MNNELITELEVEVTKNAKRIGEFSEAAFLHKAESLRLKVAKPWGDSVTTSSSIRALGFGRFRLREPRDSASMDMKFTRHTRAARIGRFTRPAILTFWRLMSSRWIYGTSFLSAFGESTQLFVFILTAPNDPATKNTARRGTSSANHPTHPPVLKVSTQSNAH
jgi:hypothetical protein